MEIPRTINDPIQFLFWSLDEIYPVAVGLIWGIWFDQLLLGMFHGLDGDSCLPAVSRSTSRWAPEPPTLLAGLLFCESQNLTQSLCPGLLPFSTMTIQDYLRRLKQWRQQLCVDRLILLVSGADECVIAGSLPKPKTG